MKRNMNLVTGAALKDIKKHKPEDTTVEEAIIIYRAHRMNAKWLSQRFSIEILRRIVQDAKRHELNPVQLKNIADAIGIIRENNRLPEKKRGRVRDFFGV